MHPMWQRIDPLIFAFLAQQSDNALEEIVPCLEQIFFDWFNSRRPKHRDDADDLAARTVERIVIYRRGFEYRGLGSFRAWCYRIARNVLHDWVEAEEKWAAHTVSEDGWQALEDTTSIVDPPDYEEDEPATVVSVRNVFQMLTALEQASLAMQVIDGLTDEEIAQHLQSTPKAVKQARYRAKMKFRELLSADPLFAELVARNPQSDTENESPNG